MKEWMNLMKEKQTFARSDFYAQWFAHSLLSSRETVWLHWFRTPWNWDVSNRPLAHSLALWFRSAWIWDIKSTTLPRAWERMSEQANEWAQWSTRAKWAVWSKRVSEGENGWAQLSAWATWTGGSKQVSGVSARASGKRRGGVDGRYVVQQPFIFDLQNFEEQVKWRWNLFQCGGAIFARRWHRRRVFGL